MELKGSAASPSALTQSKVNTPQKSIEADLTKLILFGKIERTVKPFDGLEITLHSLSDEEKAEAFSESGIKVSMSDMQEPKALLEKLETAQRPILIRSITKINDQEFVDTAGKEALRIVLGQMQSAVLVFLFMEYVSIMTDQYTMLSEGLKKN